MSTRALPVACDLVVIGGSAGSLPVLQQILADLPADFPASILVVVHQAQSTPGMLPSILARAGQLPAKHAADGDALLPGHVYVAPPDQHLLVERDRVRLSLGPKENRFRPAVDPLFRTAARAYGPRVVGVILSGLLDDGTLGLMRVKQFGGVAIVQDPQDAACPDMPASAMRFVAVDHVLPAHQIAGVLTLLARLPRRAEVPAEPAGKADPSAGAPTMSNGHDNDTLHGAGSGDGLDVTARGDNGLSKGNLPGDPSGLTCPQCGGAVWEQSDNGVLHYRCHVGHRYTADSMADEHQSLLESTLWAAMRMFEENAALHRRMAVKAEAAGNGGIAKRYAERAEESVTRTEVIRRLLLGEPIPSYAAGAEEESTPGNAVAHV